jgi:threonine/homoserine/homoserine lactone efflux protein
VLLYFAAMWDFIYIFFVGWLISFLGSIPLGNMNMIATTISVQEGSKNAWKYGVGIALIEIVYLRVALQGMDWVSRNTLVFTILGWLTVALFLVLGVLTLVKTKKQKEVKKSPLMNNNVDRFLLGMSLSALNPIQIPFWFTWSISLIKTGILQPSNANYNFFTIGAGVGTVVGIAMYIHAGKWAIKKMGANNKALNYVMGVVFIVTALIQLYKIIFSPWTEKQR